MTQCGSMLIYELLPGKELVYVVPVSLVLGMLPVVRAGDKGTIPFKYRAGLRNRGHRPGSGFSAGPGQALGSLGSLGCGWAHATPTSPPSLSVRVAPVLPRAAESL